MAQPIFRVAMSLAAAAAFVLGTSALPAPGRPVGRDDAAAARAVVRPEVLRLRHTASIAVFNVPARSVQIRLGGGTSFDGELLPWRSLRLVGGVWRGTVRAPALRGVYPILLREGRAAPRRVANSFVRVLAPGTSARPMFDDPADVVRWWVRTYPRAKLTAIKQWPRPSFDRRDPRLHRLFVVAYNPPGHTAVRDRLGMFVTAFRTGYRGRWRFLEATVEP